VPPVLFEKQCLRALFFSSSTFLFAFFRASIKISFCSFRFQQLFHFFAFLLCWSSSSSFLFGVSVSIVDFRFLLPFLLFIRLAALGNGLRSDGLK
jgi:hypothetical protein